MITRDSSPSSGGSLRISIAATKKHRILYVDAYDSFSNNITALLEKALEVDVVVVEIDENIEDLPAYLRGFDAVVVGPGPGNPKTKEDIGFANKLWELSDTDLVPILGICLGFQSLALAFGASVEQLRQPRHGIVSGILYNGVSIFKDLDDEVLVTQYHSLHVNLGHPIQVNEAVRYPGELWIPSATCPNLEPLAWDLNDTKNGAILMALRHTQKPFHGLQYHPESVCSSKETIKVIRSWWEESKRWNLNHQRTTRHTLKTITDISEGSLLKRARETWPPVSAQVRLSQREKSAKAEAPLSDIDYMCTEGVAQYLTVNKESLCVTDLCEALVLEQASDFVLLESAALRPQLGRYSIVGLITLSTLRIEYTTGDDYVRLYNLHDECHCIDVDLEGKGIWVFLAQFMDKTQTVGGDECSPFWGGFMGYFPYESALERFEVKPDVGKATIRPSTGSNLSLAFIERSIVIDHEDDLVYIQTLSPARDRVWLHETKDIIQRLGSPQPIDIPRAWKGGVPVTLDPLYEHLMEDCSSNRPATEREKEATIQVILELYLKSSLIQTPLEGAYREKIRKCQDFNRSGDSYELCLTDQSTILMPVDEDTDISWLLYKKLKKLNPAPFAAYLQLGGTTILSSSPERFLSWDREGNCQFRPIKGTVPKSPEMTKELAMEILSSRKEQAENLMIVDLIRHDLHGVVGAGNVNVTKLMGVEEYATVFQLVSVIEGQFPGSSAWYDMKGSIDCCKGPRRLTPLKDPSHPHITGLDVLASSLPPGSMTGAPKRRSCALLQTIVENKPRGCYSGVLGYIDVGGGGDFSVVIRSAYRYKDEIINKPVSRYPNHDKDAKHYPHEVWHVGAGGAITALSDEEAEWKEMKAKMDSTLAAFKAQRVIYPELRGLMQEKRVMLREAVRNGRFPELEPLVEWMHG
ncbi:MAG: para-aminobenzoate synthase, (PABA) [Candelina mexicana]|nr:MAG: para-aminobenzoate synthase, (PABA) [Candelina mexicana]